MQINIAYPSKRLLLSLFFCGSSIILLQNYNISPNTSFLVNLLCLVCGIAVCGIMFIPSIILKTKYNTDIVTASRSCTPRLHYVVFACYIAYFVYTIQFFLLRYTEMFSEKYFTGASVDLIALVMVAICLYSACRGTNIITRFGIILFAFAVISYLLIFGGEVSSLDFNHYVFSFDGNMATALSNSVFFITPSFIAVIFVCTSSYTENFKVRQPVMTLIFLAIEFALVLFFSHFVLGNYSQQQSYQTFLMSKVSQISGVTGIESFYFALTTLCVFVTISLCLCSVNRGLSENKTIMNVSIFSGITFALHICAVRINSIKEILTNPITFCILTLVFAVIVPLIYILSFRSRLND